MARLPVPMRRRRHRWAALALSILIPVSGFAMTPPGTVISNTANADFIIAGTPVSVASNQLDVTSTIFHTPASIELMQYTATGANAESLLSSPSSCAQGAPAGPFVVQGNPTYPGIGVLDASNPLDLVVADLYHQGEPIFVRLTDLDRNLDMTIREEVDVTLSASPSGDIEVARLSETDVDTGIFVGYMPSTSLVGAAYDCVLSLGENSMVTSSYTDPFDPTDEVVADVLVDPFGVIIDATTGFPVDDAEVTLVDTATGSPATVFGDDGVSAFPATITSGGSATDSSGQVYNFGPGGYRFPFVAPGNYRIEVVPPAAYSSPSLIPESDIQNLPGAPFAIDTQASYGQDFVLNAGPPLNVDVPVDPLNSQLFLQKRVTRDSASIGDFVQYVLELTNTHPNATAPGIVIHDVMPIGFRYAETSVRVDGVAASEPSIDSDGRRLHFSIGDLAPSATVRVSYVARVGVSAQMGRAVNVAQAEATSTVISNEAQAVVRIKNDLFSERSRVLGRVSIGDCDADPDDPRPGVAGVRLFMEDGSYIITDEEGRYHFDGLKPGTHIVQVDLDSLPDHLEINDCEQNTRVAGSPHSRFVDMQRGMLWRVDFQVKEKKPLEGKLSIRLRSTLSQDELLYRVSINGDTVNYLNRRLTVMLPEGLSYVAGSSTLDEAKLGDPEQSFGALTYRLGDAPGTDPWKRDIRFRVRITPTAVGELAARALLTFDTLDANNQRTGVVDNRLVRKPARLGEQAYVFRPRFKSMDATLGPPDLEELRQVVEDLRAKKVLAIAIDGHSDDVPVRSGARYTDNYELSLARARTVAEFLADELNLDASVMQIDGLGPDRPVEPNDTAAGRAANRRVEVMIKTLEQQAAEWKDNIMADSGPVPIRVRERRRARVSSADSGAAPVSKPARKEVKIEAAPGDGPMLQFLEPAADFLPPIPSTTISILHDPQHKIRVYVGDKPVHSANFEGTEKHSDGKSVVSTWRGVDLVKGDNRLLVIAETGTGQVFGRRERVIHYSDQPVTVEFLEDKSVLIADGINPMVVAVQLRDKFGAPARAGVVGDYFIKPPYFAQSRLDELQTAPLGFEVGANPRYTIGEDGIALLTIAPTTQTGRIWIEIPLANNTVREIRAWAQPEVRDWVLVGVAEGTTGYNTLSGNMESLDAKGEEENLYADGRAAFYAKGRIKGEWLLTMSYDSNKENDPDELEANVIDPERYYTLYGDTSLQRFDAPSSEKLYVRLERRQFYALFGDYNTGMTVTELGRYTRSLTGLKAEYDGDRVGFEGFASETDQTFVRDEILGDGTSGLYFLSNRNLVINSDKVTIETRDRFRSDIILERRTLTRFIDYSIDPVGGTLFFKEPIYRHDGEFNPNYIIAEYEVLGSAGKEPNAGGRGALKFLDQRLEFGATAVHEEANGDKGDLGALDLRYEITDRLELRAETAVSKREDTIGDETDGSGHLAVLEHRGKDLTARAYARQQDEDFGLGQQALAEQGTTKYGVDARYELTERWRVNGEAYHEEVESNGNKRNVAFGDVRYKRDLYNLSAGLRHAEDDNGDGTSGISDLLTAGAARTMLDRRLTLRANTEYALRDNNSNVDYPSRLILGGDYRITPNVEAFAEQEFAEGEDQSSSTTRVGMRALPWQHARLTTSLNDEVTENGARTFANLGLLQTLPVTDKLTLDVGLDRTQTLREPGNELFNPNVPPSSGTVNNDYTAVSFGANYRETRWSANTRIERREAELDNKTGLFAGFYRQQSAGFGFSFSGQYNETDIIAGGHDRIGNIRFASAYRPLDHRWLLLDRLDLGYHDTLTSDTGEIQTRKIVNNLNANYQPDQRNQVGMTWGLKYAQDTFDATNYDSWTQLVGAEYRRDINRRWDLGVQSSLLHGINVSEYDYSVGFSVGVNLGRNLWLSMGYNVLGFEDRDFSGAGYTAQGPYLKLRFGVDQQSARDFIEWWQSDDDDEPVEIFE